jgi:hypothetical protein
MKNKIHPQLKSAMKKWFSSRVNHVEKFIFNKSLKKSYSVKEILSEIDNETDFGLNLANGLLKLTLDLISRGTAEMPNIAESITIFHNEADIISIKINRKACKLHKPGQWTVAATPAAYCGGCEDYQECYGVGPGKNEIINQELEALDE